jgi:cation diffusion facilitator family transporter
MFTMDKRSSQIERASWIAITGNIILAVLKITVGIISGSLAVVGDGIDSSSDIVTSFITLATSRIISKPPDHTHPYGHLRADPIATKILAFVIFFAGAQLALSTTTRIIQNNVREVPDVIAIYVTLFSIAGKIILTYTLYKTGRETESSMLLANAMNMKNDIIISSGVLVGIFFSIIMGRPVLDLITAFIISLYIMKSALEIFSETSTELMDGISDKSIYNEIFSCIEEIKGVYNPHRTRVRKLGNMFIIDLDIEVEGSLSVTDAHKKAVEVEELLKERIKNIYDIIIHIEPLGNIENSEKFGISRKNHPQ